MTAPTSAPEPGSSAESPRRSRPSLAPPPLARTTMRARLAGLALAPLRDPNPILLKELRATFRTALFIRFLYLLTGLVAVIVVLGGAMIGEGNSSPAEVGSALFHIFFGLLLLVLCLVAPSYAATAITTERETRTYESLLLSGMGAPRIVWGKFVAYFGSIVLIVVAISPVIGVAFLFGGVSPLAVLIAFFWVLVVLATTVAWGLAVSARLGSTRIAIVLSTVFFVPAAMFGAGFVTAMGEAARSAWSVPFDGPFWFAEALAQRLAEPEAWGALVVLPLFLFGSVFWFLLASAVAGLRQPGEDRSTPLKLWAAFVSPASVAAAAIALGLAYPRTDSGVFLTTLGGILGLFIGLTFANEPPLPPRARTRPTLLRSLLSIVGPGAVGTTRFALVAATLPPLGIAAVAGFARHTASPVPFGDRGDEALFVNGLGSAVVVAAVLTLGVVLRLWSRNGSVARLLALVALSVAVLVPVLFAIPDIALGISRGPAIELRPLVALSPLGPFWASLLLGDGLAVDADTFVFLGIAGYGVIALALWLGIEAHVWRVRREDEARRQHAKAATEGRAAAAAG